MMLFLGWEVNVEYANKKGTKFKSYMKACFRANLDKAWNTMPALSPKRDN